MSDPARAAELAYVVGALAPDPGLALVVNGRPHRIRAIALAEDVEHFPTWTVDVDNAVGVAATLEAALLAAAREAARMTDGGSA